MKRAGFFLAALFCLAVLCSSVSAQTTYTWTASADTDWQNQLNWTPARAILAANDILVFNGAFTPTATTATNVPSQTIGELHVQGNLAATLQPAAGLVTLTIAGGASPIDLEVASGSALNISGGTTNTNRLQILLAVAATGSVSGTMTFSTAQHQLDASAASAITFNSGSSFTYNPGANAGNAFTNAGTANAIVFNSGSTYFAQGGANPFGLAAPASKVVFQAGSLFNQTSNGTPSFSGRTYANFEYNNAAAITVIGGSAVSINDLTITQGTLNFNMTGTPGHSIKGNISVAGSLIFNPATAGTVNLNGSSTQTISGAGTITINAANETLVINNSSGISLSRNLTLDNGTLTFTSGNITTGANTLSIGAAETVNHTSGHVVGNLTKNYTATATKLFEVGTANGYSPVTVSLTAGTFPADFTVKAVQGPQPNFASPQFALQRYWTLNTAASVTATLIFNYLDPTDIPVTANENAFVIFKYNGSFSNPGGSVAPAGNTATIAGVTSFSDWTLAQPNAPTAANGVVSGRVTDPNGVPIAGAVVNLSGTQNRKFITDANGVYRFDNVETNGFYTVRPSRANYSFSPGERAFSQIGNSTEAAFTGVASGGSLNPLDTPEYFVRQHYLDFLGREPDESGFNFWSDQILGCGNDANCIERRTINVSAAYFLSVEFQQTGGLVDRLYKASYGVSPNFAEFMPDRAAIARDVVVGRSGWEQQLAANKDSFVDSWVERATFHAAFDNLANDAYVDTLIVNTGVSFAPGERDSLLNGLSTGMLSRADVLEQIANSETFARARFNEAFVMMEYFGYLRRDPDDSGYHFWLDKLNQFNGNFERADMVKAFLVSGEYRARFAR